MRLKLGMVGEPAGCGGLLEALMQAGAEIVFRTPAGDLNAAEGETRRLNPNLLLLPLPKVLATLDEVMRRLSSAPARPVIVGVCPDASPEAILAAFRSGINEVLVPPFTAYSVQQAFERIARKQMEADTVSGAAYGFLAATGGCGATTLACHAAVEIGKAAGESALLADFDLACGATSLWMKPEKGHSVADAVKNLHRLDSHVWRAMTSTVQPKVDLLAAPDLPVQDEVSIEGLSNVLRLARTQYRHVIADFGAGFGPQNRALFETADVVYLVTTLSIASLYQARRIVRCLHEYGLATERLKLICSRVRPDAEVKPEEAARLLGLQLELAVGDEPRAVEDALAAGHMLPSRSELRQQVSALACRLTGASPAGGARTESRFNSLKRMFVSQARA